MTPKQKYLIAAYELAASGETSKIGIPIYDGDMKGLDKPVADFVRDSVQKEKRKDADMLKVIEELETLKQSAEIEAEKAIDVAQQAEKARQEADVARQEADKLRQVAEEKYAEKMRFNKSKAINNTVYILSATVFIVLSLAFAGWLLAKDVNPFLNFGTIAITAYTTAIGVFMGVKKMLDDGKESQ